MYWYLAQHLHYTTGWAIAVMSQNMYSSDVKAVSGPPRPDRCAETRRQPSLGHLLTSLFGRSSKKNHRCLYRVGKFLKVE